MAGSLNRKSIVRMCNGRNLFIFPDNFAVGRGNREGLLLARQDNIHNTDRGNRESLL